MNASEMRILQNNSPCQAQKWFDEEIANKLAQQVAKGTKKDSAKFFVYKKLSDKICDILEAKGFRVVVNHSESLDSTNELIVSW